MSDFANELARLKARTAVPELLGKTITLSKEEVEVKFPAFPAFPAFPPAQVFPPVKESSATCKCAAGCKCGLPKGPTQSTRMILCKCDRCGYKARVTRKWIDAKGAPICPCDKVKVTMTVYEKEV